MFALQVNSEITNKSPAEGGFWFWRQGTPALDGGSAPSCPRCGQAWRAAATAQHQRLDRRLPFRQCGFVLRQLRDVVSRVLQREQLPAVGQNDGIPKRRR